MYLHCPSKLTCSFFCHRNFLTGSLQSWNWQEDFPWPSSARSTPLPSEPGNHNRVKLQDEKHLRLSSFQKYKLQPEAALSCPQDPPIYTPRARRARRSSWPPQCYLKIPQAESNHRGLSCIIRTLKTSCTMDQLCTGLAVFRAFTPTLEPRFYTDYFSILLTE